MNDNLINLLNKAYFFLKFRPRTEKEIRDYLYKKIAKTHYSRDDVDKVIKKLKEQDLINDEKFIELFINDRLALKPKGKKLLIKELRQKGVVDYLIETYFIKNKINEEELALKILSQRWSRLKNLEEKKRFEKATRFLLSRGFDYETTKKTIAHLTKKE